MLAVTELQAKEAEKLKQKISNIFKAYGLTVKVEVYKKVVDFLNVTLSLLDGSHRDYMKPGQVINYVHVDSNHPSIVRIGEGVNHRLSANSSSKALFNAARGPYQEALERSGHTHKLVYKPAEAAPRGRRRSRKNIIWFNPPWCNSVTTDLGRKFLNLVDSCFPPGHRLHKIFKPQNHQGLLQHDAKPGPVNRQPQNKGGAQETVGQLQLSESHQGSWRVPPGRRVPRGVHCVPGNCESESGRGYRGGEGAGPDLPWGVRA